MTGVPFSAAERRQCRLREFETPLFCSNGPYLTQSFDELPEIYEPDEEILVWNTLDEFREKIRQVFSNTKLAVQVAERGRRKVRDKHLWQHRFREIFRYLDIQEDTPALNDSSWTWCRSNYLRQNGEERESDSS